MAGSNGSRNATADAQGVAVGAGANGRIRELHTIQLVERAQAGDRAAFGILYERYFDRVYRKLRAMLGNREDAEDTTHDVFLKLLDRIGAYDSRRGTPFPTWLSVVACNEARMRLRRDRRFQPEPPEVIERQIDEQTDEQTDERTEIDWEEIFRDPSGRKLGWIKDAELHIFVERLSELQRLVLIMRYELGYEHARIAELIEKTPQAVSQLEYRAKRALAERLKAVKSDLVPEAERVPMLIRLRQMPVSAARRGALSRVLGSPVARIRSWGR